jgi:hypothetical protein
MAAVPWYASREDVKSALDSAETARDNARVEAAIRSATESIESRLLVGRRFYPEIGTRYLAWPPEPYGRSYVINLPTTHEIVELTSVSAGGTTISSDDYFLEPQHVGPPYTRLEIDLSSSAAFRAGSTHQRSIVLTGTFNYRDERPAGTMAEALDATETAINLATAADIGVGDLIKVDSERMVVLSRAMLTTNQTLQSPVTAQVNSVSLAVTDGTAFAIGETVLLDAERMRVVDIAGNTLIVKRAHDGSVLAAHTGSTIYAARTLTVERGAVGTTAATHSDAATVYKHHPPGLIHELCVALSVFERLNEQSGWAREIGGGDQPARQVSASAIRDLIARARARWGPHGRKGAV